MHFPSPGYIVNAANLTDDNAVQTRIMQPPIATIQFPAIYVQQATIRRVELVRADLNIT